MPNAIAIGISYNDFWILNPHKMKIYANGYQKKMERQRDYDNFIAYLNGMYTSEALASTVGNMFKSKGSKPHEYPSKPFDFSPKRELTEEEKELQRQAFLQSLFDMQSNFERTHKKDGV